MKPRWPPSLATRTSSRSFRQIALYLGLVLTIVSCGDEAPLEDAGSADSGTREQASSQRDAFSEDGDDASTADGPPRSDVRDAGESPKPAPPPPKDPDPAPDPEDAGAPGTASASTPTGTDADEIDAFVVDVAYSFGIGGTLTIEPRPTILFRNGWACRDANFVVRGLDVAAHKQMFPNAWLQWKLLNGRIALQNGANWRFLDFQLKYAPNPSSLTFDKTFTNIQGVGGGASDSLVVTQRDIRLTSDHRVEVGSFAGVSSSAGTVVSTPPDRRGTYLIEGYVIEFKWDDGRTTRSSFVYSAQDPRAIYVGGAGYVVSR